MSSKDKAVLFDMDGVLVETEHLKAAAHAAAARRFGGKAPEDLYARVMGQPHAFVRAAFIRATNLEIPTAVYTEAYLEIYHHLLETRLRPTPGIPALLSGLQGQGFILALVTSSQARSAEKILGQLELGNYFVTRVAAEDVQRGKPDPEPYLTALARLDLQPNQAVAMEDSQAGIEAAAGAGLEVIALRHPYNAGQDFSKAVQVLDSLTDTLKVIALLEETLSAR